MQTTTATKTGMARKGRGFYTPRFSKGMYWFAIIVAPLYMRFAQRVARIQVSDMEMLYQAILRFQLNETRLILLFRHVAVADGPVIVQLVSRELRRWCRKNRRHLPRRSHTHFLYGKDVLNWAGFLARFAFPRMGGIPVVNGRVDKESQTTIRNLLTRGEFPLAFAPEAQVTYHQYRSFELAAGAGTLAAWAHRDLDKCEASKVELLPVGISYGHGHRVDAALRDVVEAIRDATRVGAHERASEEGAISPALLMNLTQIVVSQIESEFPFLNDANTHGSLQERIERLCERALRVGEKSAGISPAGSTLSRIFALRYWMMNSNYREDVDPGRLSAVSRHIANRRSALADAVRPYERMADLLEYILIDDLESIDPPGPDGYSSEARERMLEYALNLLDVINRAAGGDIDTRYTPGGRTVRLTIGNPIDASQLFGTASSARRGVLELNRIIETRFATLAGMGSAHG